MMATNDRKGNIVIWKERTRGRYGASATLTPEYINKFTMQASVKERSQEYIEFWMHNNILYYPVTNQLEVSTERIAWRFDTNPEREQKGYSPTYLLCTKQKMKEESWPATFQVQRSFERAIYKACKEYILTKRMEVGLKL